MVETSDGDAARPDEASEGHPAVFLDRDGVINERRWFLVRRWEEFEFRPGVLEALRELGDHGFDVIVVTNQGAVGWGWIQGEDLDRIHGEMARAVEAEGGRFSRVYACRHAPWERCACNKPRPGMLEQAAEDLNIDLETSWMVGDKGSDMEAGRAVGARTILVNPPLRARLKGARALAEVVLPGLPEAVEYILEHTPVEVGGEAEDAEEVKADPGEGEVLEPGEEQGSP